MNRCRTRKPKNCRRSQEIHDQRANVAGPRHEWHESYPAMRKAPRGTGKRFLGQALVAYWRGIDRGTFPAFTGDGWWSRIGAMPIFRVPRAFEPVIRDAIPSVGLDNIRLLHRSQPQERATPYVPSYPQSWHLADSRPKCHGTRRGAAVDWPVAFLRARLPYDKRGGIRFRESANLPRRLAPFSSRLCDPGQALAHQFLLVLRGCCLSLVFMGLTRSKFRLPDMVRWPLRPAVFGLLLGEYATIEIHRYVLDKRYDT